ncbi:MAG: DUF2752 domain-containing protein [Acidobacteriaceae bacterium]|jgi:hypothetical protein
MSSAHPQWERPVDSRTAALKRRRYLAHLLLGSALLLCAALLLYPPARFSFYPTCPIHQLLGIDCPGCGATRALAALLRGHLIEALRLNALFVLLLPAALAIAVESYRRAIRPGAFRWPQPPAPALYATLGAAVIFTVARNLIR